MFVKNNTFVFEGFYSSVKMGVVILIVKRVVDSEVRDTYSPKTILSCE